MYLCSFTLRVSLLLSICKAELKAVHRAVVCKAQCTNLLITRPAGVQVASELEVPVIASDQASLVRLRVEEVAIVCIPLVVVAAEDDDLAWTDLMHLSVIPVHKLAVVYEHVPSSAMHIV